MANCLLKEKEWSHIRIQNGISNTIKTNLPKNIFKWVKFQLIQQTQKETMVVIFTGRKNSDKMIKKKL